MTVRDGELVFFDPAGREIPFAPARSPLTECPVERWRAELLRSGIEIAAETNAPGWDGEPVDYDSCVVALMGYATKADTPKGGVVIDATAPLERVVEEILSKCREADQG